MDVCNSMDECGGIAFCMVYWAVYCETVGSMLIFYSHISRIAATRCLVASLRFLLDPDTLRTVPMQKVPRGEHRAAGTICTVHIHVHVCTHC